MHVYNLSCTRLFSFALKLSTESDGAAYEPAIRCHMQQFHMHQIKKASSWNSAQNRSRIRKKSIRKKARANRQTEKKESKIEMRLCSAIMH